MRFGDIVKYANSLGVEGVDMASDITTILDRTQLGLEDILDDYLSNKIPAMKLVRLWIEDPHDLILVLTTCDTGFKVNHNPPAHFDGIAVEHVSGVISPKVLRQVMLRLGSTSQTLAEFQMGQHFSGFYFYEMENV
jgi:hypothetical protein